MVGVSYRTSPFFLFFLFFSFFPVSFFSALLISPYLSLDNVFVPPHQFKPGVFHERKEQPGSSCGYDRILVTHPDPFLPRKR